MPERTGLAAAQTRDVYYLYDLRGLQTKARFDSFDGEGVTSYYDGFGRRIVASMAWGGEVRYLSSLYDNDGNRLRLTHADGAEFGYGHDGLGRTTMVHEKLPAASTDDYIVRYWYNPTGTRYAAVRGAGSSGFTTISYYDSADRPNAIINDLPVAGADSSIGLSYNPASQITRRVQANDSYAWSGAYNVARDYQRNGLNQYTGTVSNGTPSASFLYDPNGNLVADGTTSYVYDVENRLVSASNGASLAYDPLGRLLQVSSPATGTTRFLYDDDELVAELPDAAPVIRPDPASPGPGRP